MPPVRFDLLCCPRNDLGGGLNAAATVYYILMDSRATKAKPRFRNSLALQGLFLLAGPIAVQIILGAILIFLHVGTEIAIKRAEIVTQTYNERINFSLSNYATLTCLRNALPPNAGIEQRCFQLDNNLKASLEHLRSLQRENFPHDSVAGEIYNNFDDGMCHLEYEIGRATGLRDVENAGQLSLQGRERRRDAARHLDYALLFFTTAVSDVDRILSLIDHGKTGPPALRQQACQQAAEQIRASLQANANVEEASRQHINRVANPNEDKSFGYFWETVLVAGTVLDLLLLLLIGLWFSRKLIGRIAVITANSLSLASDRELNPPLKGSDELSQLDRIFHDMAAVLRDATKAEKTLIENARDLIFSLDSQGRILSINAASKRTLGYEPDEMRGFWLLDIIPSEDHLPLVTALQGIMAGHEQPLFETRMIKKDGSTADLSFSISASQEERTIFCIAHDIGEKKSAERFRHDLLQTASRNFMRPLDSVRQLHQMLAANRFGRLSDKGQNMLAAAASTAGRIFHLIDDLLNIEGIDSGLLKLDLAQVSIESVFRQAVQSVQVIADGRSVKLEMQYTSSIIKADEHRLVQVIVNLLSNAIKFSPAGASVSLSAEEFPGLVEIKVKDEGRGIPVDLQKSVFERFKQVKSTDSKEMGGTGLGLAICKSLIDLHGGSISLDSQIGKGSTFCCRLPINGPADSTASESRTSFLTPIRPIWSPPPAVPVPVRRQETSSGIALSRKVMFVLAVPIIIQVVLLATNACLYDKARQTLAQFKESRDIGEAAQEFILHGNALVNQLDKAINQNTDIDSSAQSDVAHLKVWSKRLRELLPSSQHDRYLIDLATAYAKILAEQRPNASNVATFNDLLSQIAQAVRTKTSGNSHGDSVTRQVLLTVLAGGGLMSIALIVLLGRIFHSDVIGRLTIVADNSRRLANGQRLLPRLPGNDEIAMLDAAFQDMAEAITASARRYHALITNARDVICALDAGRHFVSVNNASQTVLGQNPEELIGTSIDEMIYPEDRNRTLDKLLDIRSNKAEGSIESRLKRRDGTISHVILSAKCLPGEDNTFCVVHDISDFEAARELRRQIVQMVNHDVRTPLTTINGIHQMFAADVYGQMTQEGKQLLSGAEHDVLKVLALVTDLLLIEKLESGMMELNTTEFDVSESIDKAMNNVRNEAGAKQVHVRSQGTRMMICADPNGLEQIISKLLFYCICLSNSGESIIVTCANVGSDVEIQTKIKGNHHSDKEHEESADDGARLAFCLSQAFLKAHDSEVIRSQDGDSIIFAFRLPKQKDVSSMLESVFAQ